MAFLRDDEIRRVLAHLRKQIFDSEQLAEIEDELKSEFGTEILREPEILSYFPEQEIENNFTETIWNLRIISYTSMRMVQRGIDIESITDLFNKFLKFCDENEEIITVGAYSIFGRPNPQSPKLTLRLDIDEITDKQGKAHTVTIFVGRGNTENITELILS